MARNASMCRILACGSVDDGKSTLLGRLLRETGQATDDQLADATHDGAIDDSRLLDGLSAEREQGITIDVAYRHFRTPRRAFILADCPGHEQYTRNMATGASNSDVAILLVDAAQGVREQSLRHLTIAALFGIRTVIVAVNKMDLVDYDADLFAHTLNQLRDHAKALNDVRLIGIPVSALRGDNVTMHSAQMPWYEGPTLLDVLETVDVNTREHDRGALRIPVQYVSRTATGQRLYLGTIAQGEMHVGDSVRIQPDGQKTSINEIYDGDEPIEIAGRGQSVAFTVTDERDIGRGSIVSAAASPCEVAEQFEVDLLWMDTQDLVPGRTYDLQCGPATRTARIMQIKHRLDVVTLGNMATRTLELNEIGRCTISLDEALPFESFDSNHDLGSFILIDKTSHATSGAGLIRFALRRSHNIHWQTMDITNAERARSLHQDPKVVWLTGLSGAGKSTIADLVDKQLNALGRHTFVLDGDNIRHGLNRDLGFTEADRVENIRRVAEVANLMADAGLIVLVSLISPYRADRELAREIVGPERFAEVFVDIALSVAEERDAKGLYAKARRGEIRNFTGIDAPYEAPEQPEIHLHTAELTPEQSATRILEWLGEL